MRWFVCVVVLVMAGCAGRDVPTTSPPGSGPHFSKTGPDATDYGAASGYPIGDRTTFTRIPQLVGSHSHLDALFPSRVVRRAATPSTLARAAVEPTIRYVYQDTPLTAVRKVPTDPAGAEAYALWSAVVGALGS